MRTVRQPAVSGTFYPDDPDQLRSLVREFIRTDPTDSKSPKAIIAPHAGYVYSGRVAGIAYAQLTNDKDIIRRVVLIGPSHRKSFSGIALTSADQFESPLGTIAIDKKTNLLLSELPFAQIDDSAHENEHCLEVHLPFIQEALTNTTLVPIVVGQATTEEIMELIKAVWDPPETIVVISSDLSHYLSYDDAKQFDDETSEILERLEWTKLTHERACGASPICGLLHFAEINGLTAKTLALQNSGDTAGPKDNVVGYGAYAIY